MDGNFENAQIPRRFLNRRQKFIYSDIELNNFIQSTILEWAEKDFTCPNAIQTYIYQTIEPHSMKLYFSQNYNNIQAMKNHVKLVQSVNSHIYALFSCRPAVTFLDIYKMIEAMLENNQQRLLGPITKIPIIKSFIFGNTDVSFAPPDIRLSDLICDCANFLTERILMNKKRGEISIVNSLSEKQFLHFLLQKYHVNDFNLLGVKIVNFQALREGAYAAKGDSFHKLIVSEKIMKLLRSDVKAAIKNIRANFAASEIFQIDNKPLENLAKFANLSFQEAIKQFFQPFLDEEERLFTKHNIDSTSRDGGEDSLAVVRQVIDLLLKEEMHGRLFQLAAIGGTLYDYHIQMKRIATNLKHEKGESCQVLIGITADEWRSRIFCPLLSDVHSFNQLYLSSVDNVESCMAQLGVVMTRIVEKCLAISHLFPRDDPSTKSPNYGALDYSTISQYKRRHLTSLSSCCHAISQYALKPDCLTDKKSCAQLHLDLLPQVHHLLILIMSRSRLSKQQLPLPESAGNFSPTDKDLINCIFTAKLWQFVRDNTVTHYRLSLDSVCRLERAILDVLRLSAWPLDGSFLSFFSTKKDVVREIIEGRMHAPIDQESLDAGNVQYCQGITVRQEFVQQIMRQLPATISFDQFLSHTLPSLHGTDSLPDDSGARQMISTLWHDQTYRQSHLLADGLSPAIDLRPTNISSNISWSSTNDMSAITDPEQVMRAICAVPLLGNVPFALKWNALYRHCWGDICQFVNDHSQLAATFNVRLILSEMGVIRVNAFVTAAEIESTIANIIAVGGDNNNRQLIGQIVSVLVAGNTLMLSRIIDLLSTHSSATTWLSLHRICISVLTTAPPELIVDVTTQLVYPLAVRMCDHAVIESTVSAVFTGIDSSIISMLKIGLPPGHPLRVIIASVNTQASAEKIITNQQSNPTLQPAIFDRHDTDDDDEEPTELQIDLQCAEMPLDQQQECRAIVEDIRVNEYGVDATNSNASTSGLVASFNRKMARLVEHLSSDLYANATHFVLELVQNADDNRYLPTTDKPALELCWMQKHRDTPLTLVVRNNEVGFMESDLRSLCDIGASTKSGSVTTIGSKIGRKGIGFKSVFLVSDQPEIHSNGFHVQFQRYRIDGANNRVPNNALVPTWCTAPDFLQSQHSGTAILLPIIPALARGNIRQSVTSQLRPHLLLFLRNLTRISIASDNNKDGCEHSIELVQKECTPNRKVVLTNNGQRHSWFICKRRLPVTDVQLQQLSPRGVSQTELSVAISTDVNDGTINGDGEDDSQDWPAFAYLPIRSYGLRFIVNADFAIPASREDIVNESPWNKWLIAQLGDLFTELVRDWTVSIDANNVTRITQLIGCVPLPGEVPGDSSFHALISQLRASLSQLAWLPDRSGRLHAPTQLIAEVFDDGGTLTEVLCDRLQLSLLHPTIASNASERTGRVLSWLGCQKLSLLHLSKLLAALTARDFHNRPLMQSIIIAIHGALERDSLSSMVTTQRVMTQLSSLPIWPVMDVDNCDNEHQSLISISKSPVPVFLLPNSQTSSSIDRYPLLRRIISPDFIAAHEPKVDNTDGNSKKRVNAAVSILQRLNVPELSSSSMVANAILPVISRQNNEPPSRDWLVSASHFLVDQCHPSQYRDTVIPLLSFATIIHKSRNGTSIPTISNHKQLSQTHLPPTIEAPHRGVVALLCNNIDYVTIDDDAYLSCSTELRPGQWREFFLAAGVSETFYSDHDNESVTYPEIGALLDLNIKSLNIDILRYLDRNWVNLRSDGILAEFSSRVCIPICTNSPAVLHEPDYLLASSVSLCRPSDAAVVVYLSSNDPNKQLMPDSLLVHFPFCPVVFTHETLPQHIGMASHVGLDHVTALLHSVLVTKSVSLTGHQSRDLYRWIQRQLSPAALATLFSKLKSALGSALLIAIPAANGNMNDPCELVLDEHCYWTLPIVDGCVGADSKHSVFLQDQQVLEDLKLLLQPKNNIVDSHKKRKQRPRALMKLFPDMRDVFVDVMQVRLFPTVLQVWDTLESLLQLVGPERLNDQLNNAEIELITDVYNVVQFLDQHHDNGEHRTDLLRLRLLPCINTGYRAFADNSENFSIYSWRSFETVHAFQQHLSAVGDERPMVDFLTINCFPNIRRDQHRLQQNHPSRAHRCTAPQFLLDYFNLPVLEDEMRFKIDNRDAFQPSTAVKSMLDHLEVIVSQWFQRNVSREGVAHCVNMLSSITRFLSASDESVAVAVSLRSQPHIGYRYSETVYIGAVQDASEKESGTFEVLIGGVSLEEGGMQVLDHVMDALIGWLLRGDSFVHLRDRFRKFYKNLFDLIESSDRNQVSIFIRSHNLRINPFSIDYIYDTFGSHHNSDPIVDIVDPVVATVVASSPSGSDCPAIIDLSPDDQISEIIAVDSPSAKPDRTSRTLKRKVCVSIENSTVAPVPPQKQARLQVEDDERPKERRPLQGGEKFIPLEREIDQPEPVANAVARVVVNTADKAVAPSVSQLQVTVPGTTGSGGRSSPLSARVREQFTSQKYVPLSTTRATSETVAQISGRIGEQLAYEKLSISQCLGEWEIVRVDWVNQHAESRLPYDFKLTTRRPESTVPEVIYLEVKATTQTNKRQFDLSPQEVTAAWSFKEFYHLLLVFHSGNYPDDNIKFVHIPDTLGQLQDNQCKLLLDVGDLLEE